MSTSRWGFSTVLRPTLAKLRLVFYEEACVTTIHQSISWVDFSAAQGSINQEDFMAGFDWLSRPEVHKIEIQNRFGKSLYMVIFN